MQAIVTRYVPATNSRDSRMKAKCARGSVMISYDYGANDEEAHKAAASALVAKFCKEDSAKYGTPIDGNPWNRKRVIGSLPSGETVHVYIA